MRCHPSVVFVVLGAAFAASTAWAGEVDLKPGRWSIESRMSAVGGQLGAAQAQMQEQLAGLPPEQRKMMEAMMSQQGIQLGGAGGLELTRDICMTREMIEQNQLPVRDGKCRTTLQSRTGNEMKMRFECTDPRATGEGHYTVVSPEAYTMKMTVRTTVEGRPEKMTIDASGRWRGADCAGIAPGVGPPAGP